MAHLGFSLRAGRADVETPRAARSPASRAACAATMAARLSSAFPMNGHRLSRSIHPRFVGRPVLNTTGPTLAT